MSSPHSSRALFQLFTGGICALLTACTYTVDSTADAPDANPGDFICARAVPEGDFTTGEDGLCTLRAAIMEANATAIDERIEVPAGVYPLALPVVDGTELVISSSILIRGAGAEDTIIDGGGGGCVLEDIDRPVFRITAGNVGISGVTIQRGSKNGIQIEDGNVEIADTVLRENMSKSSFGGAVRVRENGSLTIRRAALIGNCIMGSSGGAIFNEGELFVHDSLITDNHASIDGGGIWNSGLMNLRNTTVTGNFVSADMNIPGSGGIEQHGFAVLNNVTVTDNAGGDETGDVGGIRTDDDATTVMKNSIVAGNVGGASDDCLGELTSDSRYNLIGNSAGCGFPGLTTTFLLDVDPLLGPLANNGGPTLTHALLTGSPARETGSDALPGSGAADACEARDQRGVPRPQGAGVCDMGAFEAGNLNVFVTGFVLVDADTNQDLQSLRNGELLNLSQLPTNLSVRAHVSRTPGSVKFAVDRNLSFHIDNAAPFALGGDKPVGDYIPVPLTPGTHTIRATPFSEVNGKGIGGGSLAVTFQVIQSQ